jgi:hypothetical protein
MWVDYHIGLYSAFAKGHVDGIGHFWEQTPFCPCREENLSPITGERENPERDMNFLQLRITSVAPCVKSISRPHERMNNVNNAYQEDELDQHMLFRHLYTSQSRSVP